MDVKVTDSLLIPSGELSWRFSRSAGPGGQHVNTSDSRVELSWDVGTSAVVSDEQRVRLLTRLAHRLVGGTITIASSEQRSQLRNREIAGEKLGSLVAQVLAADAPARRASKPTRGSKRRHQAAKQQRSQTKSLRRRPHSE